MTAPSPNIYQRLHAVMQEVDYVQKEKKQGMNYTIVSHDAVTAKVRPSLVKHGVVYHPTDLQTNQDGNRTQVLLKVRFVNIDNPDDFVEVPGLGYGIDSQDKGPGKAISYAVKYCLLKALGLETGDDADNESVEHKPAQRQATVTRGTAKPQPAKESSDSAKADWALWDKQFRADFLAQPSYLTAKTLINNETANLKAYAEADPEGAAALKAWLKPELANKANEAAE